VKNNPFWIVEPSLAGSLMDLLVAGAVLLKVCCRVTEKGSCVGGLTF
jgi:hypothetical protein